MKNVQIIDGAQNCVYDIFSVSEAGFQVIFHENTDIAFIEDLESSTNWDDISNVLRNMWTKRIPKRKAMGIHGTIFYGLLEKKIFYPTLRDEEAINPNGSNLRSL